MNDLLSHSPAAARYDLPAVGRELRATLALAAPLILAQVASMGMVTTDTLLAGRFSPQALAALAVGGNLATLPFVLAMGYFMGVSAITAQWVGAGLDENRGGALLRRVLPQALAVGLAWCGLVRLVAVVVLPHLNLSPETRVLGRDYAGALSFAGIGNALWMTLRFAAEGAGVPRAVLASGVAGFSLNALLSWTLMYGHFGLPRLGVEGAGYATSLSSLAMAGVLAVAHARVPALARLGVWRWRWERAAGLPDAAVDGVASRAAADIAAARRAARLELPRIGVPIAGTLAAEVALFALVGLGSTRFGETVAAAYQVAINLAALLFMVPLGMAQATTVRTGQAVGAGSLAEARFRGFVGMGLAGTNAALNATVLLLGGALIAGLYTKDPRVVGLAAGFMGLAAGFQFFDGLQVAASGALRGVKDTRMPFLIGLAAYWLVGAPAVWWAATRFGPSGLWLGLTAALGVAAAGLIHRFHRVTRRAAP